MVSCSTLDLLLKKDAFQWFTQAELAFEALKQAVSNPLVHALLDFSKYFMVECDASGIAIGAIPMHCYRLLAFHNQALKGRSLHSLTFEKEFLALITAVKKWRPYLVGNPFIIRTNQQSLKYLLEQKVGTPAQQKWITKLLGYSFLVEYKKGKENKAANSLSRKLEDSTSSLNPLPLTEHKKDAQLYLISFPCSTWLNLLKGSYKFDSKYQSLLTDVVANSPHTSRFSLQNDLLLYKGKVFLSSIPPLKPLVLQHVHNSPLGGSFWLFVDR